MDRREGPCTSDTAAAANRARGGASVASRVFRIHEIRHRAPGMTRQVGRHSLSPQASITHELLALEARFTGVLLGSPRGSRGERRATRYSLGRPALTHVRAPTFRTRAGRFAS
jgi:hypothetical protein